MNGNDPLTPEERELARRLGPDMDALPSPAVDARILAAARAQLAESATASMQRPDAPARRHRRGRWPAALGLAASVTLAVGVAWQLRQPPRPEATSAQVANAPIPRTPGEPALSIGDTENVGADAASDAGVAVQMPAPVTTTPHAFSEPDVSEPAAPKPDAVVARSRTPGAQAFPAAATQARAAAEAAAETEATEATASAAHADRAQRRAGFTPPAPPAPPAPPPPVAAMSAPAPAAPAAEGAASREAFAGSQKATAAARAAPASAPASTAPSVQGQMSSRSSEAAPAYAPAPVEAVQEEISTADTLAAPTAGDDANHWLQRIRLQRDQGDLEGARTSLLRFRLNHPDVPVPEDLRPLLLPQP